MDDKLTKFPLSASLSLSFSYISYIHFHTVFSLPLFFFVFFLTFLLFLCALLSLWHHVTALRHMFWKKTVAAILPWAS